MYSPTASGALTLPALAQMKRKGEKIVALTAYDSTLAHLCDAAGVDIVLVGDSLGMVVQGHPTTLPVTMDQMVYHCATVSRGLKRAWLIADMPFASYPDPARTFANAARLVAEGGAAMVKLEGAGQVLDSIAYLAARDVPVCAHLGLTPQSVYALGGFKLQGKEASAAEKLRADALGAQAAGATLLVLECIPAKLGAEISAELAIPTIGIGAGAACDGQILVCYDMLGMTPGRRPKFSQDFLEGAGSVSTAIANYAAAVRSGGFPSAAQSF